MGMFDDQYVDNNTDPKKNSGWGRKGDTGKGGYKDNDNADKSGPAFMNLNATKTTSTMSSPARRCRLSIPSRKATSFPVLKLLR